MKAQPWATLQVEGGELALAFHSLRHRAEQGVAYVIELQRSIGCAARHLHRYMAPLQRLEEPHGLGMAGSIQKKGGLSFEACLAKMFNVFHVRSSCFALGGR